MTEQLMKLPLTLVQVETWPFDLYIQDAARDDIVRQVRFAYSSADKTIADVMEARHHGPSMKEASAGNKAQVARLSFIVKAVNAHDELVAALRQWADNPDGWNVDQVNHARALLAKVDA